MNIFKWYTKSDFEARKHIFNVDVRKTQTRVLTHTDEIIFLFDPALYFYSTQPFIWRRGVLKKHRNVYWFHTIKLHCWYYVLWWPSALHTNDISIEFEIRPTFEVRWFNIFSTDHTKTLQMSRPCNYRDVCIISLWSVVHVLNQSTQILVEFRVRSKYR